MLRLKATAIPLSCVERTAGEEELGVRADTATTSHSVEPAMRAARRGSPRTRPSDAARHAVGWVYGAPVDPTKEKYVSLTTYKRDGTPVSSPVWCAPLEGATFGFWTSSGSGKAKRLAHTAEVLVQPCNGRGKVKEGTSPEAGTARVVSGEELAQIRTRIVAKYGFFTKVTKFLNSIGNLFRKPKLPYGDRGVVVTLGSATGTGPGPA
jgi:PPOX class probable F420-dependent enzyme